ncbi:hypothetical protein DPMN_158942 [Dreissena polymorpha]|uniref:Uncharacterized protein n=1 Tax=Dreissena polymorpha TaxID=45954 RepID=A0A9D4IQA2_DREPO|nr:hypothetical protein DPMN_158942 [Dreissena polymorpha]
MSGKVSDPSLWVALDDFCCPAKGCRSKNSSQWVCAKDKKPVYMNALGQIQCEGGKHRDDICKWGWKCGRSFHKGEYIRADQESFVFAMSQALQL